MLTSLLLLPLLLLLAPVQQQPAATPASPTTEGSAPSIPAQTITTSAVSRSLRTASSRCNPATPTLYIRVTLAPNVSAVTAASSATGRSLVPAHTTAIWPPSGSVEDDWRRLTVRAMAL